jgi:hypothetical protein
VSVVVVSVLLAVVVRAMGFIGEVAGTMGVIVRLRHCGRILALRLGS